MPCPGIHGEGDRFGHFTFLIILVSIVMLYLPVISMGQMSIKQVTKNGQEMLEIVCITEHEVYCADKPDEFLFQDGCRNCKCHAKESFCRSKECVQFTPIDVVPAEFCKTLMEMNSNKLISRKNSDSHSLKFQGIKLLSDNELIKDLTDVASKDPMQPDIDDHAAEIMKPLGEPESVRENAEVASTADLSPLSSIQTTEDEQSHKPDRTTAPDHGILSAVRGKQFIVISPWDEFILPTDDDVDGYIKSHFARQMNESKAEKTGELSETTVEPLTHAYSNKTTKAYELTEGANMSSAHKLGVVHAAEINGVVSEPEFIHTEAANESVDADDKEKPQLMITSVNNKNESTGLDSDITFDASNSTTLTEKRLHEIVKADPSVNDSAYTENNPRGIPSLEVRQSNPVDAENKFATEDLVKSAGQLLGQNPSQPFSHTLASHSVNTGLGKRRLSSTALNHQVSYDPSEAYLHILHMKMKDMLRHRSILKRKLKTCTEYRQLMREALHRNVIRHPINSSPPRSCALTVALVATQFIPLHFALVY